MKVYAVINQKGGVGKTTTAAALAAGLKMAGKKIMALDLDRQRNFTRNALITGPSILEVLKGEINPVDALQPSQFGDMIPGSTYLNSYDGNAHIIKDVIDYISKHNINYDYCIIDTPPALGLLTVAALTAADGAIITASADLYAIEGVLDLAETISAVKKANNPALKVEGILLTNYIKRRLLSQTIAKTAESVAAQMDTKVFKTTIRQGVAVPEAQAMRKTLFEYAPRSGAALDYKAFIAELTGIEI